MNKIIKFVLFPLLLLPIVGIIWGMVRNFYFTGSNVEEVASRIANHPYGILSVEKSKKYGDIELIEALKKESDNFNIVNDKVAYSMVLSLAERKSPEAINLFKELYSRQNEEIASQRVDYLIGVSGLAANNLLSEKISENSTIVKNMSPSNNNGINRNGYLVSISLQILSYLKNKETLPYISKVFSDYPQNSTVRLDACKAMFEVLNHQPNDEYKTLCEK